MPNLFPHHWQTPNALVSNQCLMLLIINNKGKKFADKFLRPFLLLQKKGYFYLSVPMKKRIFLSVVVSLLFFSCRKTYTCECYTTFVLLFTNSQGASYYGSGVIPGSKTPYTEKLSEKQARAACRHEEAATEESFTKVITNNGSSPLGYGESVKTSCGLK